MFWPREREQPASRTVTPAEAVAGNPEMLYRIAAQARESAEQIRKAQAKQTVEVRSTHDAWVGGGGESYRWRMALEHKPPEKLVDMLDRYADTCEKFADTLGRSQKEMRAAVAAFEGLGLKDPLTFTARKDPAGLTIDVDQRMVEAHLALNPNISKTQAQELIGQAFNAFLRLEQHRDLLVGQLSKLDIEVQRYPDRRTQLGPSASDAATEALLRRYTINDPTRELTAQPGSALSNYVRTQPAVVTPLGSAVMQHAMLAARGEAGQLDGTVRVAAGGDGTLGQKLLFTDPSAQIRMDGTTTVVPLSDGRRQVTVDGTYTLDASVDPMRAMAGKLTPLDVPGAPYQARVTWSGTATYVFGPNGKLLSSTGYP